MPENQSGNGKLDSWKEIASYLGRDVRTVIRWEKKRNLPVHRLPGGQAVFAYKIELDDWVKQGGNQTPALSVKLEHFPAAEPLEPPLSVEPERPGKRRLQWRYVVVLSVAGVFAILLGEMFFLHHRSASSPASLTTMIEFSPRSVQGLDRAGHVIWTHAFPKMLHSESLKHVDGLNNLVRFADLYGDGSQESLVAVPLERSTNQSDVALTEIDCFSNDGKLRWSYLPREKFRFGAYDLDGPWIVWDVFVSAGPKPAIWVALGHYRWGNSFVAQLDPATGRATVRFVNTGTIYKLNEAQISGKPYLLIGGFNNEYAAGILAAMDEAKSYAVSPQTEGTRHKCVSCAEGAPDYYFVFPRSEVNRLRNLWEDSVRFINVQGTNIEIEKSELGDPALGDDADVAKVHVVYDFHAEPILRPVAFRFDSWYDMLHRDLEGKGKLDHALGSCPERLHPEPVRLWTPAAGWAQISFNPLSATD